MVHSNKPTATTQDADGEWDLVDGQETATTKLPQDPSSFVFVLRDNAAASGSPDAAPTTPPLQGGNPDGSRKGTRVVEQPAIRRHSPSAAPAKNPEEALARMSNSPQLPLAMTPPAESLVPRGDWALKQRSPPPADNSAPAPPVPAPLDPKLRRDLGTTAILEEQQRHLVVLEADAEHRALVIERRNERQRLGDSNGLPSAAGDAEIDHRRKREAESAATEVAARRRDEEELQLAMAISAERTAQEMERAKAGPRTCECLGASGGHHRATCPLRTQV